MKCSTFVLLALSLVSICGCTSHPAAAEPLRRFTFAQAQMGLEFQITLFATNEAAATQAVTNAFARIAELNGVLSDYNSDSELSQLARTAGSGRWVSVSDDLWRILHTGQQLAEQSDGAFDLTIGPSVNLWRRARRRGELPDPTLVRAMRERVGHEFLVLSPTYQAAKLTHPMMRLDAGGIAKGYAMDEALRILRQNGIHRAMIHGGGDMIFGDRPPAHEGWIVQLPEPSTNSLVLANVALATSGDLEQYLEVDGTRYSHIIDPRTGIGLTDRRLVHVIAPDGITADSLSTTLNILGSEEATALIATYTGVEFQIQTATDNGPQLLQSDGFRVYFRR